jgi:hypothetical protein
MFRNLIVFLIGALGLAMASSTAVAHIEPHIEHISVDAFIADQGARPDGAPFRINSFDVDRAVDALLALPVTAGVESLPVSKEVAPAATRLQWFSYPTFYVEYDYIHSLDDRRDGADSITNSAVVGFDFVTIYDILLGFTYSYSNRDAHISPIGLPDDEDAHFFNLYTAKTFWQWINIGVSGGYGYTSLETVDTDSGHEDTWSISPFVGLAHTWGPWSASVTPTWTHTWTTTLDTPKGVGSGSEQSGRLGVPLKVGYAVTEKLKVQVTARYNGITNNGGKIAALPEDRNWGTFGGKITYRVCKPLSIYGEYLYDAFNDNYENHNVHAGLTLSW